VDVGIEVDCILVCLFVDDFFEIGECIVVDEEYVCCVD